jgi:hypothetical protein
MITDILKEHLSGVRTVSKCTTGKWLETQEPEVVEMLSELSKRPTTNVSALFRDLEPLEVPFRLTTFKLHMKGNCQCPKAS